MVAVALVVVGMSAVARAEEPPWERKPFSADGRILSLDNMTRAAVRFVFDDGSVHTLDVSYRKAEKLRPDWGWSWGREFVTRRHDNPRYDEIRLGKRFFRLRDGKLVLYQDKHPVWSTPARPRWKRLGDLHIAIAPGDRFLIVEQRVGCYEFRVEVVYRSADGNVATLREVQGAALPEAANAAH